MKSSSEQAEQKQFSKPSNDVWTNPDRSWSDAERADMDKFLNELTTQAKPRTEQTLSEKALAMARQMGQPAQNDGIDMASSHSQPVEPYSLEMYFDAFLRKLNRSAAFVKNDPKIRGVRKALVEISLNSNGSLRGYRVLRTGDQEAEIAYVKSVIERAAPFSAFPPDIRKTSDSLSILMCIHPAHEGFGGGFSRSSGAQDCTG